MTSNFSVLILHAHEGTNKNHNNLEQFAIAAKVRKQYLKVSDFRLKQCVLVIRISIILQFIVVVNFKYIVSIKCEYISISM